MKKLCIVIVVIILLSSTSYTVSKANTTYTFQDIDKTPWASEAIQVLYDKGIINGYNKYEFGVNDPITREQLAKLLALAYDIDKKETEYCTFMDVNESLWSYQYIEAVKQYLTGYFPTEGEAFFSPKTDASREEVAVALVRIMGIDVTDIEGGKILAGKINDLDTISPQLIDEVAVAYKYELIKGFPDGTLRGNESISRAAVATMLYRVMKYSNPRVSIDVPPVTSPTSVRVKINVEDDNFSTDKIEVWVNGGRRVYNDVYGYYYDLDLLGGKNRISITAINPAGKKTIINKIVDYKITPPVINIDNPKKVNVSEYTLKGSVDDNYGIKPKVTINNEEVNVQKYSYRFEKNVTLFEGINTFIIKAQSSVSGKITKITKEIVFDPLQPIVEIDIPSTSENEELQLVGKVYDNADDNVHIGVNGEIAKVSKSGKWEYKLKLKNGDNKIVVLAINKYGKITKIEKVVTYINENK